MKSWKSIIQPFASDVERHFDNLWYRLQQRFDHDPVMIQPYVGHGNTEHIMLRGRVMQDNGISTSDDRDSVWANLLNTYRRFATDEIPYARVKATVADQEVTITADDEGFFEFTLPLATTAGSVINVALELLEIPHGDLADPAPRATGRVFVPPESARFGVISDLDDTVLQSDVLNWIKLAKNTFLRNAHTRLPFAGVSAFYRALQLGSDNAQNPIYYVSNSPWNLYDLLTDFFELRDIPQGPLFLQDIGIGKDKLFTKPDDAHKHSSIQEILDMQSHLSFILIGDSTQRDPEIYHQVAMQNPDRINSVYVRDVNKSEERSETIHTLANELDGKGIPMILVKDTLQAAIHAYETGLIGETHLKEVAADYVVDNDPPDAIDHLILQDDDE